MPDVELPLDQALNGPLPAVCVMTGAPADGGVPLQLDRSWLRWRSQTIRVPMSKPAFRKWLFRNSLMLRSRTVAILLIVGALGFSTRNALIALLLLLAAGLTMAASVWAEKGLSALQPGVVRKKGGVTLTGCHDGFVEAIRQSG